MKKLALIFSNGIFLLSVLLSFQIMRALSILGALFFIVLLILLVFSNLAVFVAALMEKRNAKSLLFLLPLAFSVLSSFFILKYSVSERIALKLEFSRYKSELDDFVRNGTENENIRIFGDYAGIIWDAGFVDNYSVIIFDENNNLDELYESGDKKLSESFSADRIIHLLKIQDNYFRCNIYSHLF